MSRLTLIRHAHVETRSRMCGWYDIPLSDRGRRQVADAAARSARQRAPDALYTSSLTRAQQAAEALGRAWGLEPRVLDDIREIHCGAVEGMGLDLLQQRYPELWTRNLGQSDDTFAWPGGETYCEFRSRVVAACAGVAAAHPEQRVVVVTHAGVISQILGVIRGRPAAAWDVDRPDPFTATEVLWENGRPAAVLTYNEPDWY